MRMIEARLKRLETSMMRQACPVCKDWKPAPFDYFRAIACFAPGYEPKPLYVCPACGRTPNNQLVPVVIYAND